ncbi:MAG: YjgN family protein [Pseudomonadota bacterium]
MNALQFQGNGFEYFKIWIVNILLTIVTLGLYHPWAKVRNRRYFYANTTLDGHNFEYHATGKQLFVSHMIAMALLLTYLFVTNVAPLWAFVFVILFFVGFPWVIWRGLMFNMRMTSFSNVRFGFEGTLGQAYVNYMALPIVAMIAVYGPFILLGVVIASQPENPVLTGMVALVAVLMAMILGVFAVAWLVKRNHSYVVNGQRYGQGAFSVTLDTSRFAGIYAKALVIYILGFIALTVLFFAVVFVSLGPEGLAQVGANAQNPEVLENALGGGIIVAVFVVYAGVFALGFAIWAYTTSRTRAYVYSNATLDSQITFASSLKARRLFWVMFTNGLLVLFTLGLGHPWAKVRMTRLFLNETHVDTSSGIDQYVTQKQEQQSSLGEQIGDAFDVGVDVAF